MALDVASRKLKVFTPTVDSNPRDSHEVLVMYRESTNSTVPEIGMSSAVRSR